jgi:hypothetical protein
MGDPECCLSDLSPLVAPLAILHRRMVLSSEFKSEAVISELKKSTRQISHISEVITDPKPPTRKIAQGLHTSVRRNAEPRFY